MANRSVSVFADPELGIIFVIGGGSSSNRLDMGPGDVLTVTHTNSSPASVPNAAVGSFSSNQWTSTSAMSISRGSSQTRTVKTGATNATPNLLVTISGYSSAYIYLNIVSSTDSTPNAFSFSSVSNAIPGTEYALGQFTVTGINVGVTASASGTAGTKFRVNNGTLSTGSKTVTNNDRVYVYGTSSSSYNTSTSATISIGGVSHTATITTPTSPPEGTRIPIGVSSGAISLDNVRRLFGPSGGSPGTYGTAAMSNYYRGGTYVPNITTGTPNNSNIPTSGQISLSNFYNSFTSIFFQSGPNNKYQAMNTTGQAPTATVSWYPGTDWTMGYGPDMEDLCEYKFVHEVDVLSENIGSLNSATLVMNGTSYNLLSSQADRTSSYGTGSIYITVSAAQNSEAFLVGTITVTARHRVYTSYTISRTMQYNFAVYGP